MSKKKIIEDAQRKGVFLYDDHRLVTRRDFMGAGLIQFSAFLTAPTLLSALLKSSIAKADCSTAAASASTLPAFAQVHLSGGAAMSANFIPRGPDGQLNATMDLLGLGSRTLLESTPNQLVTELGVNAGFFVNSGFLAGLRVGATAATLAKTSFIGVPVQSRDDTNMNHFGLASLVDRAGLSGKYMNVLTGQSFGTAAALVAPKSLIAVNSIVDLDSSAGVAAPLGNLSPNPGVDSTRLKAVFTLMKNLSDKRVAELLATPSSALLKANVECSGSMNEGIASQAKPVTSPRADAQTSAIWGLANRGDSDRDTVFAGCLLNTLRGFAGPTQLSMGGYDYHNNTRTSGDAKDLDAGTVVGKMLETAAAKNVKLFLTVVSDGSVRSVQSATSNSVWTSDRGQAGCAYVLIFDPAGRPALSDPSHPGPVEMPNQIGYMVNQSADQNFIPGWSPELASLAIFANYLKFGLGAAWKAKYDAVVQTAATEASIPVRPISDADLQKILRV